jgi:hypothetical protein
MRNAVLAAGLGLMLGSTGLAKANLVFTVGNSTDKSAIDVAIDERTTITSAKVNGVAVTGIQLGEQFSFFLTITPVFFGLDSASRDMTEPPLNLVPSDRLKVTGFGFVPGQSLNTFLVNFGSDSPVTVGQGNHVFNSVVEDGTFQPLFYVTATDLLGNVAAIVNFRAASELEPRATPEPATILGAAASILPLALGYWWRKRRRAIA